MIARIVDSMTGSLNWPTTILFFCAIGQKSNVILHHGRLTNIIAKSGFGKDIVQTQTTAIEGNNKQYKPLFGTSSILS